MQLNDKCAYRSDVYCFYEVAWAINDDHYKVKPRFLDSGTHMCKTPCPYLETDGTLRHYPDLPEPEESECLT